jgi:iron complex transport system substrate-binding protein
MASSRHGKPPRIVSLAPSVSSILVAIGARQHLVGVSKWCADVADVGRLPRVGDCWAIEALQVMRLKPTLIIGSVPFKPETVGKLLELPAAFLATNPRSLEDIESDIRLLGRLTNRDKPAERLIAKMRRGFADVAKRAKRARSQPRVYCEAWPNPRITSPPWVRELVEIAGGRMVLPAGERVSDEEVAQARPEVIVLAWAATGDRARAETAFENPSWLDVPAVRRGRVQVVRDELLNTPGPPLVEGAEALLRALHPEQFVDAKRRA